MQDRIELLTQIIYKLHDVKALSTVGAVYTLAKLNGAKWNMKNGNKYGLDLYNYCAGAMPFHELSQFTDNKTLYPLEKKS